MQQAGSSNTSSYDCNGHMTGRTVGGVAYTLVYDAENRLQQVKQGSTVLASYTHDADGNRVKAVIGSSTTITKYYQAGGQRIALRVNGVVRWLATDHLGSTALTVSEAGGRMSEIRYKPWGESRYTFGATPTQRRFTGQVLDEVAGGLYFYNARYYDPALGRFASADTLVPQPQNPQNLNRYSYAANNSLRFTDPTGHCPMCVGAGIGALVGAGIAWIPQFSANLQQGKSWDQAALRVDWGKVAAGAAGGAVSGATLGIGTAIGAGGLGTMALGGVGGILGGQAAAATKATWDEASRWSQGQEWDGTRWFREAAQGGLFDTRTAVFDAAGGVLSAGLGYKLDKVVSGVLSRYGDHTFKGGVTMVYMLPGKGSQGQFGLRWDGRTVTLPASEFENMMKKLAGGTFEVSAEAVEQLFEKLLKEYFNPSNSGAPACP